MDRNTLVGIALIVGLFLLYGTLTGDDDAKEKKSQSEKARTEAPAAAPQPTAPVPQAADSAELSKRYGPYAALRSGGVQKVEVKTEDLHLLFTNKGGVPEAIYLNKHKTYDGAPLPVLPTGPKNSFSFTLPYNGNVLSTQDLFFSYQGPDSLSLKGSEQKTLRFRAQLDSASYLEYVYSLKGRGYDLDWEVRLINMRNYVQANRLELLSGLEIPKTEKDAEKMLPNANLVYALAQDEGVEVNHLDVSADEEVEEELNYSTKWVSFKSQFFQLALIAQDKFEGGGI
ncbi:MAG: membrane protein insertase YidC, partial [Sphingobacteriia bacterium]